MRLDYLFAHCADLGLEVEWKDLGDHRRGEYHHGSGIIVLNRRLTRAQATATCSHEVAHSIFGDTCSTPANERRAWEFGASLIITPSEYAEAESLVGPHKGALAVELGVTNRLIESWQRWYSKRYPVEVARRQCPDWAQHTT